MIETICECCGGKVILPDPIKRNKEEKIKFRQEWDKRVEEGNKNARR